MRVKASLVSTLVKVARMAARDSALPAKRSADAASIAVFQVLAFRDALAQPLR